MATPLRTLPGGGTSFDMSKSSVDWSINNNRSLYCYEADGEGNEVPKKLGNVMTVNYCGTFAQPGLPNLTAVFKIGVYGDTEECDPIPTVPEEVFIVSQSMFKSFCILFNQRFWKPVWESFEEKRRAGTLSSNKGAWLTSQFRRNTKKTHQPKQKSPAIQTNASSGSTNAPPTSLMFTPPSKPKAGSSGSGTKRIQNPPTGEVPPLPSLNQDDMIMSQQHLQNRGAGAYCFFVFDFMCVCV